MIESLSQIVLVEDNADDAILMQRAFTKLNLVNPLLVITDGEQAVAHFTEVEAGADPARYPVPALVLLDLKLPRYSGLEVLDFLRRQPRLKHCPVVVLTSSREAPDIRQAYDLGANSYLIKPVDFQAFVELVRTLNLYWLVLNNPVEEGAAPGRIAGLN